MTSCPATPSFPPSLSFLLTNAMAPLPRLTSDIRSNLVAYLDGELDEETADQIDRTVAQNEVARREVEQYARTYELLDELPETGVSKRFTQTALQAVSQEVAVEGSVGRIQNVFYRIKPLVLIGLTAAAAAAAGTALGASLLLPDYDERLRLLPVAESLPMLEAVSDADFLIGLSSKPEVLDAMREQVAVVARQEDQP